MTPILESNEAFWPAEERRFVRLVDQYPARHSLGVFLGRVFALAFVVGFVGFLVMVGW